MSSSQSVPADHIRTILSLVMKRDFNPLYELSADRAVRDVVGEQVRKLEDAGLLEPTRGTGTGFTEGGSVAWRLWKITPLGEEYLKAV